MAQGRYRALALANSGSYPLLHTLIARHANHPKSPSRIRSRAPTAASHNFGQHVTALALALDGDPSPGSGDHGATYPSQSFGSAPGHYPDLK